MTCRSLPNKNFFLFRWFLVALLFLIPIVSEAQIGLTISKSNNAPNPIPSGQPFTYTITYSWTGGAPGTLYIVDNVPAALDVISASPAAPISNISGNVVTFKLTNLTLPSGSGTVQINARFKPGVTCGGAVACNVAGISTDSTGPFTYSNESCVIADTPTNKWTFEKEWIAGCACDDEVIYRIKIMNPAGGDIGGLNLTNVSITDLLPAGAQVVSVTPGSFTGTPPNITLAGVPSTMSVSPWPIWYVYYVRVKYPCSNFQPGQTVVNSASISFNTPCNQKITTWTDTASTVLCQGVSQGNIYKSLSLNMYFPNNPYYLPVWAPGCCGTYLLSYTNSGTLSQPGFVMEDVIPGHLDVNAIKTYLPTNDTVKVDVYCWSGSTCSTIPCTTVFYNSAGLQTLTGLPAKVCKVKWTYSKPITVQQNVYNYLDVCVRDTNFMTNNPVVPGDSVVNTVTVSANNLSPLSVTHTKVIEQTKPKVLATKLFIGGCNNSCQVTPNGPFHPGDTVRFRMAVANIGNLNAIGCTINDVLPSGLSYVGNETYYYGSFNWMANIYYPPCCSTTTTVPTQIGGTITTPTVGDTNLTWTFLVLPSRCDGVVEWFIIEFDVKISDNPPAAPGQYPNQFTIGANFMSTVTSNVAYLTVNQTAQLQAKKEIRTKDANGQFGPWSTSASVPAGGTGEYLITVKNTGNTPLTNLCLLDIMPWIGDIKVLPPYNSRGSTFNLPYDPANGALTIPTPPTGFTAWYNSLSPLTQTQNPTRTTECGGFCGVTTDPTGAVTGNFVTTPVPTTYSFKVSANPTVNLAPGASLNVHIPFVAPTQVKPGERACNSFGVQAIPLNMPNVCLSTESNNACLTIEEGEPCIKVAEARIQCITKNANGQWVYQLQFNATNLTGTSANVNIFPNSGTISSITPTSLPPNVPTDFTVTYVTPNDSGQVCFTLVLFVKGTDRKLCDTTFCLDLRPCLEPCPCPFNIKIERAYATQGAGDQVSFTNLLSVLSNPVLQVRATIVSATVNEYCFHGGQTSYVTSAVFTSSNLNPILTAGIGTSELTYTNYQCPDIINKIFKFTLNIPSTPKKGCYQRVKVCIRYTITDCECKTCDTLVCYEFTRKWMPIQIPWDVTTGPKGIIEPSKENMDIPLAEENLFMTMQMKSETEGTLTINNPREDEYTAGITIHAISVSSALGIKVQSITPRQGSWTDGVPTEKGMTSTGILEPGNSMAFDIVFENSSNMKSWMNYVVIDFTLPGIEDTLSGVYEIKSRTPGIAGGDELNRDYANMATAERAKTFALSFTNNNNSFDDIAKVVVRVVDGTILAVGPQLDMNAATLEGYRTAGGEWRLLAATPEGTNAIVASIPPKSTIEPLFVSVVYSGQEYIEFEFETYTKDDELVTKGKLRVYVPTAGLIDDEIIKSEIYLYEVIPNPVKSDVQFKFKVSSSDTRVNLTITDARGAVVAKIIDNVEFSAGEHLISYDTSKLVNGVYYLNLSTPTASQTRKLVIVR